MMLSLNDGRAELWQWDTGRTLSVDADCSQVHFSNKVFGRSIDVDVVGGAVVIPDILLQTDKDLNVWAFVGTAENGYTKISKTFKVNRRNKPSDYVFTPTDQITLQTIQSQIGDLDDLTTEAKDTLVAAINEAARTGGGGGGSTIELDTTLTQSGKAADAKAVGDALADKQDTISDLEAIRTGAAKGATALQSVPNTYRTASEQDTIDSGKVDKVIGKGLSSNDYTDAAKAKVDALAPVATSGNYNDLTNKPTIPTALPNPNALTFTGAVTGSYDGSEPLTVEIPSDGGSGSDISLGLTGATVGQIAKITAVDASGAPTAWSPVDMPSGSGGHWETVLDTVWEQDVIHPTAYDAETGIFTCAEGELNNLELNKEYVFFQQCVAEGAAYNTILNKDIAKVTKLSDTTFSIDVTPPTTFVPANVKFSRGAYLAITDIDAKKIRLTLDGQFKPASTLYDKPFFGIAVPYLGRNTGYAQIRNAYQAYQQVTAEVESPYRIVGKILCGFNAPSNSGNFHFKNNSFCCPFVPYDVPEGKERTYLLTSDGTKIAKLYSTGAPWNIGGAQDIQAILNDYLKIISGTKVKLERWVE